MSIIEQNGALTGTPDRFETAAARILADELPTPVRQRWQPLRAGLMNLFLFEDERFPFADGRLLLRGSNGTGKSRVLAMTLPLLLDGSFKATRVEPDRDPTRQVVWNLLMDDQSSRTGYSWLEFGRFDESGTEHFFTIGCGMKAARGQSIKPWFFLTSMRVDETLSLKSADGVPLTQRQLAEALGDAGQVIETATEYRRAIDEKLFRLGDRYEPLIDLLLQLRQPQLAKKLDLDQLEQALRMALPPLSETLLDNAADAFRELDHFRTSLETDRQSLAEIQRFLNPYRQHVRRGVKRSLKQLTTANSRYEQAQRDLRELVERQELGKAELQKLASRQQTLQIEIASVHAAIQELDQSPEMRDAKRLDELRERAKKLEQQQSSLEDEVKQAGESTCIAEKNLATASRASKETRKVAMAVSDECRTAAAPESLQNRHHELLEPAINSQTLDPFDEARQVLQKAAERFLTSSTHLIALNIEINQAEARLLATQTAVESLEQNERSRRQEFAALQNAFETCRETVWDSILSWHQKIAAFQAWFPAITYWSDQWHAWAEDFARPDPSQPILRDAQDIAATEFAARESRLQTELDALNLQRLSLAEEQYRLESGASIAPPTRANRDPSNRVNLPGAAFWTLVEFHPDVPNSERGNWEAALQDAGLLDAWLTPDGRLLTESVENDSLTEVQLADAGMVPLDHSRQLARVLRIVENGMDEKFNRQSLERILSVIGVGVDAGLTWIAKDGRWRNGPLHGQWTKPEPQYIGEETRARWRRLRLDAIAAELRSLDSHRASIELSLSEIGKQREELKNLVSAFPDSHELRQLNGELGILQRDLDRTAEELRSKRNTEREQREELEKVTVRRDQDAADSGLSGWTVRADELHTRLREYLTKLLTLDARVDAVRSAIRHLADCIDARDRCIVAEQQAQSRLAASKIECAMCREQVRAIEETAGQGVAELLERLANKRRDKERLDSQLSTAVEETQTAKTQLAVNESSLVARKSAAEQTDSQRRAATGLFASLHAHEMIEMIVEAEEIPVLPWSMTQAIKLARRVDSLLEGELIDDESWHSSQNRIHQAQTELQPTILAQDGMAIDVDHLHDGLQRVTLTVQGERLSPVTAVQRLETEIGNRERILDEREQETLEKYLLGEVADGLRNGMRMASSLVDSMTKEVSTRPMKSGMQLRFKWKRDDDGPQGLAEACEVLETASATWSPEERDQIKQFLQRSIRSQRETGQSGSWQDHLRAALDYRLWHRIVIERRSGPDANWLRLTRRTYGSGSGGEKAIALTLPQLAAAAAYYESAHEHAPRFILLDEAFAGISSDMRESCMELIASFRLDLVMTSEIEWGCYPGVPQLAICQLDRFAEINAVVNRVFVWNGSEKRHATSREERDEIKKQPLFSEE